MTARVGRLAVAAALLLAARAAAAQRLPVPPAPSFPDTSATVVRPFAELPAIPLLRGETLFVRFAVHTDTMVAVLGATNVVAKGCGLSYLVGRVWKRLAGPTRDSALVGAFWTPLEARMLSTTGPADTTVGGWTCQP